MPANDELDPDIAAANESEDPIATMNRRKGWTDSEPVEAPKKTTFKAAFAAARKAGDKTFEWEGKKYTTALASNSKSSGAATSPERTDSLRSKQVYETSYDRMNRENRNAASARRTQLNAERQTLKDNMRKLVDAKSKGLAKGGMTGASKRADGIASKGKTRCKMY